MGTESTIQLQDAAQVKADAYLEAVSQYAQSIKNDSSYVLHEKDVQLMIEQTLDFVRDNELLTQPTTIESGSRFRTDIYNNLLDGIKVDLAVTFARLRALIKVIITTTTLINANTYSILSEIDDMLDLVSNLSNLKNTFNQYDKVIHNTFIEDDNTHKDLGYRSKHSESGGIITLRDILTDNVVEKENNFDLFLEPLNDTAVMEAHNSKPTNPQMSDGLDVSIYAGNPLHVTDFQIGFEDRFQVDPETSVKYRDTVPLTYNGGTLAVIVRLPSIKFVNHISMKFAAAGILDVLHVMYSIDAANDLSNFEWIDLDVNIDTNNIRGADINFETKEAAAIAVVLGQKSVKEQILETDKGIESLIREKHYDLAELSKTIEEKANVVHKGKLKEVAGADVVKTLSDDTAGALSAMIEVLDGMLPPEDNPIEITDPNNYHRVQEYNFCIYDMEVDYIHYFNNSTFKSDYAGGRGDISNILLTNTGYEPSIADVEDGDVSKETTANFYIELENGQHRIIPHNVSIIKDIYTVEEAGSGQTFDFEVLADDAEDIQLFINNEEDLTFSKVKQYTASDVVLGITTSPNIELNLGDSIVAVYQPSPVDTGDREYSPYELSIDEALGNPVLNNQDLTRGNESTALLMLGDESFISYEFPTEIRKTLIPAAVDDEEPEFGFEIVSGSLKIDIENLPSGFIETVGGGAVVPSENVVLPSRTIYNGVIDEPVEVVSGATEFNTDHEYIRGTLHAFSQGKPIKVNEYDVDTTEPFEDKTYFNTNSIVYESPIIVSYMAAHPGDEIVSAATESNIADYNLIEFFNGTDNSGVVTLPFYPHLDMNIRNSATGPGSDWIESIGKFVNRNNEEIIYEPILITISGRIISNRTDYRTGKIPSLSTYIPDLRNYEYYIDGNKVIFNTIIKGQLINVSFYKQNDKFRLVSKLYRTNRKVDDITPEVYGYSLYLNQRE